MEDDRPCPTTGQKFIVIPTQPYHGHLKGEGREEGLRQPGEGKQRERNKAGWRSWDEARTAAANRENWRNSMEA